MNKSTLFVPKTLLTVPNKKNSSVTTPGSGVGHNTGQGLNDARIRGCYRRFLITDQVSVMRKLSSM